MSRIGKKLENKNGIIIRLNCCLQNDIIDIHSAVYLENLCTCRACRYSVFVYRVAQVLPVKMYMESPHVIGDRKG